ncbi:MAG TPA: DNA replication complex GINS family protein [Methanocorpusculum sp.]|nr:DNA replication complex GINS family protein [Methanocorpusculum sp.]
MQEIISLSKLHEYILDERKKTLTTIPPSLYQNINTKINSLVTDANKIKDPFSPEFQSIMNERESYKEYLHILYELRTQKIFSLALAKANGDTIDNESIKSMIPNEKALYESIYKTTIACKQALIDGKEIKSISSTCNLEMNSNNNDPNTSSSTSISSDDIISEELIDQVTQNELEASNEPYNVVMIKQDIDEFQDINGKCYNLCSGDIVSLSSVISKILCDNNIALNISLRK